MNLVAILVLNVIYLTGITQSTEGVWSQDLSQRLTKHSCKAGSIQKDATLLHRLKSGTFTELGHVKDLEVCVLQCCESERCELALFTNNFCYGITCYSSQHCKTVPAYEGDSMVAVFVTKAMRNITKRGTKTSQSGNRYKANKRSEEFVFYPVDSSSSTDLAFSVNLRNIAKHYVHDENVRKVLTAKADEHLIAEANKNIAKSGDKNASKLDEFLSKSSGNSSSQDSHAAQSGKRSETIPKPTKQKHTTNIQWRPKLLKAAISSSSVALLIVLLVLLAMTRKKKNLK